MIRLANRSPLLWSAMLAVSLALSACAPAPIYQAPPHSVQALPAQVAQAPAMYLHQPVVWGGTVIGVHNYPDHSEIEVLAYPLDDSQRPRLKDTAGGRFIAVVQGYVEPFNYPGGSLMTLQGTLVDSRAGLVDRAAYTYPVVQVSQMHRWTAAEMQAGHVSVSFGVGVVGGIR